MFRYITILLVSLQLNIFSQEFITVVTPNGGEVYCGVTPIIITWETNISGGVEIQLFKGEVFHSSIVTSTPSDGSYSWHITGSGSPSFGYQIGIMSIENGNIYDISDSTFTIGCALSLVSPNGGEIWHTGTIDTIFWTSILPDSNNLRVDLYKGGVLELTIPPDPSQGTANDFRVWEIPNDIMPGNDYKISILDSTSTLSDISEINFIITHPTSADGLVSGVPKEINLYQNYPNPFNPTTIISYEVPELSFVTLKVYDILGRLVKTLVSVMQAAGEYSIEFNAEDLSAGVYFYTFSANDFYQTRKMILLP